MRLDYDDRHLPDADGRVTADNEFRGQMIYVPQFWSEAVSEGTIPDDGERVVRLMVNALDRNRFPELKTKRFVTFLVKNGTFIREEK